MLAGKLEEVMNNNKSLSESLKQANIDKAEIEKCLEESTKLNKEQMEKSNESFEKLQETIKVADEAVKEIESLTRQNEIMEDECINLAQTIGSVMEKASEKIDKDVEELKAKHQKEIENSFIEIERLKSMISMEKAEKDSALKQNEILEEKLKTIDKERIFFGKDLQAAIESVVSLFLCVF
jgi:chromosome segregation ATPase